MTADEIRETELFALTPAPDKLWSTLRLTDLLLLFCCLGVVVGEVLHRTIHLGCSPVVSFTALALGNPFFCNLALTSAGVFCVLRPSRREGAVALVLGIVLEVTLAAFRPNSVSPIASIGLGFGIAGLVGQIGLAMRRVHQRKFLFALARYSIVLPASLGFGTWQLSATPQFTSDKVYDLYLYAADACFGSQLSFVFNHWFQTNTWVGQAAHFVYQLPALFMVTLQLLKLLYPERFYLDPTLVFTVVGAVGGATYSYCPAVGPHAIFQGWFPTSPPVANFPYILEWKEALPPRNVMPSLHIAWALSTWWLLRCVNRRWGWLGLAYLVATVPSAFLGTHYVVDYVMAVPLTAGCFGLLRCARKESFDPLLLTLAILCAVSLFLGITFLLHPWLWWRHPIRVVVVCIGAVALGIITERRLGAK